MSKAVVGGYNEFKPVLIKSLPEGSRVTIGRRGSPEIYVTPAIPEDKVPEMVRALKCDNFSTTDGVTYIWWD